MRTILKKTLLAGLPLAGLLAIAPAASAHDPAHREIHRDLGRMHEDFHQMPYSRWEHRQFHREMSGSTAPSTGVSGTAGAAMALTGMGMEVSLTTVVGMTILPAMTGMGMAIAGTMAMTTIPLAGMAMGTHATMTAPLPMVGLTLRIRCLLS